MTTTTSPPPVSIDTSPAFSHSCVESAVFPVGIERAYGALFDLTQWERLLPHIVKLEIAHDDGQYQEFRMTVQSERDGSLLTVRSVRNCTPGSIEFFQPEPPAFLRHHGGIWRFAEIGEDATQVTITHVWNVHPERAEQLFPAEGASSTEERIANTLAGHSRLTLETWRTILGAEA